MFEIVRPKTRICGTWKKDQRHLGGSVAGSWSDKEAEGRSKPARRSEPRATDRDSTAPTASSTFRLAAPLATDTAAGPDAASSKRTPAPDEPRRTKEVSRRLRHDALISVPTVRHQTSRRRRPKNLSTPRNRQPSLIPDES